MLSAAHRLRHKRWGQRARSDILGGNEFEIEADFASDAARGEWTGQQEEKQCKLLFYGFNFSFCSFMKGIFTLLINLMR